MNDQKEMGGEKKSFVDMSVEWWKASDNEVSGGKRSHQKSIQILMLHF